MMKKTIWTLTFIIIFLAVYIEAVSRVNTYAIWGYVCAIDFAIIFTLIVSLINTGNSTKK